MSRGRPLSPVDGKYPNRLREVRLRLGKTHQQIGKAIGVSGVQAGRLERGSSRLSDEQITRLAEVFGVAEWEFRADQPNDRTKIMLSIFSHLDAHGQNQLIKIGRTFAEPAQSFNVQPIRKKRS